MNTVIHPALSEKERIRLAGAELRCAQARMERWLKDNLSGRAPPRTELVKALESIRNTLQEIA